MESITLFVPTFNEATNISGTLETIKTVLNKVGKLNCVVLVVDDFSSDNTVEVVNRWGAINPEIKINLIKKMENSGLGNSYMLAIDISESKYFMYLPGDNVISTGDLEKLLANVGESDLIVPHFGDNDFREKYRLLISSSFTYIISLFSGIKLPYYNGPVIANIDLLRRFFPNLSGFSSQAEFLCRSISSGANYKTIQIMNEEREFGDSKAITIKNILLAGYCFIRVFYFCRLKKLFG